MLIKLAIYSDKKHVRAIEECCKEFDSYFIPLIENKFGILTEFQYKRSYGFESSDQEINFNVDAFINIYKCMQNKQSSTGTLLNMFRKNNSIPYVGIVLDNQFFFNLLKLCQIPLITFNWIYLRTDYGDYDALYDIERVKQLFLKNDVEFKTLKLHLSLDGIDIMFDEGGYIDIAAKYNFYEINKQLILDMIVVGLKGDLYE